MEDVSQITGVLVDHQIRGLALGGMIDPFDPVMLNPASLDIRIGNSGLFESSDGQKEIELWQYSKSKPFSLLPGECILVGSIEVFNIPESIAAEFKLKSSRAREWYQHMLAGWIDPGFSNSVATLEIKNAHQYKPLPIYPGLRIGQIIFYQLAAKPSKSYRLLGRYNGDKSATASKG